MSQHLYVAFLLFAAVFSEKSIWDIFSQFFHVLDGLSTGQHDPNPYGKQRNEQESAYKHYRSQVKRHVR